MIRNLFCQSCGEKHGPHPEDTQMGFSYRKVHIDHVKTPEDLCIIANDVKFVVHEMICDRCSAPMPAGVPGYAVTMWREDREGVPGPWELEYTKGMNGRN